MATRPRFFIVRPDTKRSSADGTVHPIPGPIVPLIAIDELPEWLDIVGVPRELAVEETIGLCNLGTASKSKVLYDVKIIHNATTTAGSQTSVVKSIETKQGHVAVAAAPQTALHSPPTMSSLSATHMPRPGTAAIPSASHPADRMRVQWNEAVNQNPRGISSSIHSPQQRQPQAQQQQRQQQQQQQQQPLGSTTPPTPTSSSTTTPTIPTNRLTTTTTSSSITPRPPAAPETEYCRHWCHHGTCKWGLHCRHLHAMPTTPAELAEVGLREIPAWWVATAAGLGPGAHHHHHPFYPLPGLSHPYSHLHPQSRLQSQSQSYSHSHGRGAKEIGLDNAGGGGVGGGGGGQPAAAAGTAGVGVGRHVGLVGDSGGLGAFDPRDVRAGVMRRMGVLSPHAVAVMGALPSAGGGGGGGGGGASKKVVRALLRELGLGMGNGNGNGRGRRREANNNPLEKGKGMNAEKEGLLRAARAEMASAAAAAAAVASAPAPGAGTGDVVGQRQIGAARAVQEKGEEEGKKGGEQGTVGAAPMVVTQHLGKLVDV